MKEQIPEISFVAELVKQHYHLVGISLHRLRSDSGKCIYRIEQSDTQSRIVRLAPASEHTALYELANVLTFLEEQGYPAERIVQTTEGTACGTAAGWHFLMTTFLTGKPLESTLSALFLLGAALGRLHALKPAGSLSLPTAAMLPAPELAFAHAQLSAVASLVPTQYLPHYEMLETALAAGDHCTDLPAVLIHNDCHPANALLTAPDQVTLFDWEGAGLGPAILDVGFLLANCDGAAPWASLPLSYDYHPDRARLNAAVDGYCQYHGLTSHDLNHLPAVIRFRSLVFGACSFASSIAQHGAPGPLQWWWARYSAAEEIADIVSKRFVQRN